MDRHDTPIACHQPSRGDSGSHYPAMLQQLSAPTAILFTVLVSIFFLFSSHNVASAPATASISPPPPSLQHVDRIQLQRSTVHFQRAASALGSTADTSALLTVAGKTEQTRTSLLSTLQNYGSHRGYNHTFHSQQLNTPAVSAPHDAQSSHDVAMSNRAIGHSFPTPLPHLLTIFSSSLAMVVFASDVHRMELAMDTFGRYLPASHILYFVPDTEETRRFVSVGRRSNVYLLQADTNGDSAASHSANHHILLALQTLVNVRPDTPFYYLCDDDTLPIIPRIASYLYRFYHDTMYKATDKVFLGETTLDVNGKVQRLVGSEQQLDMMVSYHPAAGGLLLNNALAVALYPHTSSCPLLSTWDVTLAYCMDLHVPDHHLLDLPLGYHLHAVSMDAALLDGEDDDMHTALAYADMRQAYLEFGSGASEVVYWREMELRAYSSYIQQAEELVSELKVDVEAARLEMEATEGRRKHRLASLAPSVSAPTTTLASPLRVLLINSKKGDSTTQYGSLSKLVYSLMRQSDIAPLALLTQLDWDTSYMVITGPPTDGCRRCDVYHRPECADMYVDSTAAMVPHIQHQSTEGSAVLETHATKLDKVDYGAYDIVLTLDAVLPFHITGRNPRPFYAHYVHTSCEHADKKPLTLPAPGYHLHLHSHLSHLDAPEAGENTVHFPTSMLYHGIFQSLLNVSSTMFSNRTIVTVLVGVDEAYELSVKQSPVLTSVVSQLGLSEYRTVTPVIQPEVDVSVLLQSRVCLFLPGLFSSSLKGDAVQQRAVTAHVLHAMAAGCLVVVTEEVAGYTLAGERGGHSEHDAMRLLLSSQTTVTDQEALLSVISSATDPSWLEREVAYQRTALNAHMLEKPLHSLLNAYTQHSKAKRA